MDEAKSSWLLHAAEDALGDDKENWRAGGGAAVLIMLSTNAETQG